MRGCKTRRGPLLNASGFGHRGSSWTFCLLLLCDYHSENEKKFRMSLVGLLKFRPDIQIVLPVDGKDLHSKK